MRTRSLLPALLAAAFGLASTALQAKDMQISAPKQADPELQRFVHGLLLANPEVQAARAALDASAAMRDAAERPLYNPELEAELERSSDDARTLGISQTLDWAGKRGARSDAAERERLLAETRYTLSVWAIGDRLLSSMSRYQTAAARLELATRSEGVMSEFAELAERRFRAGDLGQVDLSLARLAVTDARIQRATRAGESVAAQQELRAIAVDSPTTAWPALSIPPHPDAPAADTDQDTLLRGLPEILAAERQVDLNEAYITVRRKERRPDPTLSLRGGEQAGESLVGLGISIPLFVRNRFDNEVRAALADRDEARFSAEAIWRHARARLESARERYALLRSAWAEWERTGQPSLKTQSGQLHRLWQAGELGTTEYLVQLRQTFEVQDHALQLRLALWESWFEWLRASGHIDDWLALDTPITEQRGKR